MSCTWVVVPPRSFQSFTAQPTGFWPISARVPTIAPIPRKAEAQRINRYRSGRLCR